MKKRDVRLPPELVPEPLVLSELDPDGRVVLLVPRFRSGPLARWLLPRLSKPHVRVRLDELGSYVWQRCDGATSLGDIERGMAERFGAELELPGERLGLFVGQLDRSKLLRLLQPA